MATQSFEILATDPITQIPAPVEITTDALRQALLNNPGLLVSALHDALERRFNPNVQTAEAVTLDTSIRTLITESDFVKLSPAAQRLTRGDLMALAGWGNVAKKSPSQLGLDVQDIQMIREVFGQQLQSELGMQGFSLSCCSCTPCCCCAVAVAAPERALA